MKLLKSTFPAGNCIQREKKKKKNSLKRQIKMNEPSLCEIERWIKDLFEDTEIDIPDFSTNNDCLKLMLNIISHNKEAEKDAEETIKSESYLCDYYASKRDDVSSIFADEFSVGDLHPDIAERVKKIAHLAVQMKLKEPTITCFLLSSSSLDNEREFHTEQELIDGFALSKFSKKISEIIHKNAILERNVEKLVQRISGHENIKSALPEKSSFFKIKGEQYVRNLKKGMKQLKKLDWNSSLSHNELVKRYESLQCLEQKEKELSLKLQSYENLPANEMLTQFKIEEAKTELLRLQKEFDSLLKII